ncbi:NAD(P)H-dependent oxidoreductase [Frankia sp. R82]|uniref:NADPH-dependent FMN reductase n=1 Tax=Frankia sp. R82 TaxID=2950553 RepID=UPI0020442E29|nr:NAD(P)H-dependent oxidoreductase [Frankia sp. R82]MCM3884047.1 NAD(P)H-dependent oxidoreductase [Frankia sp. R82]
MAHLIAPSPATSVTAPRTRPLELAVLLSSVRPGRLAPTVGSWFTELARGRDDVRLHLVDPAATPLNHPGADPADPAVAAARTMLGERLAAADGFVVITPEYNHSYPAALKHILDSYRQEWFAKPVGFVSYGGMSGGLRAVEHLRGVFAELHAVSVRDGVSLHGVRPADFAAGGRVVTDPQIAAAAAALLNQLAWWGRALREAREVEPYAA